MQKTNRQNQTTNDRVIRLALKQKIFEQNKNTHNHLVIEELGVNYGVNRVDIAVLDDNIMHGYEIKSDLDNLNRLPKQIKAYDSVFGKMTIVVGQSHLLEALDMVPEWWGIAIARHTENGETLIINQIRNAEFNNIQDGLSIARLLWRNEALNILEELNMAKGFRSKPRDAIYTKLSEVMELSTLDNRVRETLIHRELWRSEPQLTLNGG